jgi:acetyl-CoA acetyltransferase
MSRSRADALGIRPLARIRGFGDAATEPLKVDSYTYLITPYDMI